MKTTPILKFAAACAALISSPAFAQLTLVDGSMTMTDSNNVAVAWDLFSVSTSAIAGSASSVTSNYDTTLQVNRTTSTHALTSATTSGNTLSSITASTAGLAETYRPFSPYSRQVQIKNLELDLAHTTVYADIYTMEGTFLHQTFLVAGTSTDHLDTKLTGSLDLGASPIGSDGYLHASGVLANMYLDGTWDPVTKVSTGSLGIINRGLSFIGLWGGAFMDAPFADVSFDVRFAVPEPSTYALMVCGFASLALVARRKSA